MKCLDAEKCMQGMASDIAIPFDGPGEEKTYALGAILFLAIQNGCHQLVLDPMEGTVAMSGEIDRCDHIGESFVSLLIDVAKSLAGMDETTANTGAFPFVFPNQSVTVRVVPLNNYVHAGIMLSLEISTALQQELRTLIGIPKRV